MEQILYSALVTSFAMIFGILATSTLFLIAKVLFKKRKTVEVSKIKEFLGARNLEKSQRKRFENLIKGKSDNYKVIPPRELEHLTY